MPLDDQVVDLLLRYEELRGQGQSVTPEELCRDCPALLGEVRLRLRDLDALAPILGAPDDTPPNSPAVVAVPGGDSATTNVSPAEDALAGRYRLVRFHAHGGLGEVFLARDEELQREVALKRIQARHHHHEESRRRFLLEAEITGRLEHPGVVPVYGLGRDADGQPCYAMRFIEGETFQEAIRRFHAADRPGRNLGERSLALRGLLTRYLAVCNTIAYAHSRGILHRDLKPSNIMLGRFGETLVVDWGLARPFDRAEEQRASDEQTLTPAGDSDSGTQTGQAVGTPAYMSPEQAAGKWDEVGPASDLYSLGAVLYVLLAGQAPFKGEVNDILDRVKQGDFPPPGQVKKGVPPALAAVCLKAMAQEPANRYASALELAAEVERWLADDGVEAHRESLGQSLARFTRRHRSLTAAAAVLLVGGVVALGVGNVFIEWARQQEVEQAGRAEQAHREAVQKAQDEESARIEAEAAQQNALRKTLESYHSAADADLAAAGGLWHANSRVQRQQEALDLIKRSASLQSRARDMLGRLGPAAGLLATTEPKTWEQRRLGLRCEAARWLTGMRLARLRTISLPPPPANLGRAVAASQKGLPEFRRTSGWYSWLGWIGAVAVSPDNQHIAVAYPGATELLVVSGDKGDVRRLPLPKGIAEIRLGMNYDFLRFNGNDRIEMSTAGALASWRWPEGKVVLQRYSPEEGKAVKERIIAREEVKWQAFLNKLGHREAVLAKSASYTASRGVSAVVPAFIWDKWVTIRPTAPGSEPRVVAQFGPGSANPEQMVFGNDPRLLYVLAGRSADCFLLLVDVVTGVGTVAYPFEPTEKKQCLDLVPCSCGIATLEGEQPAGAGELGLHISLWAPVVPRVWGRFLGHELPVNCMNLAADGLLVTAGQDNAVRLWKGPQRVWSSGSFPNTHQDLDSHYPFWDFAGAGKHDFVVERKELLADNRSEVRTEIYRAADGRLLRALPSSGPNRIFARSLDRRFAAVVAGEKQGKVVLDLWSLEEGRILGRLGTYLVPEKPKVVKNDEVPEEPAPLSAVFSPSGRWLIVVERPSKQAEIWQVAQAKRIAQVALPGIHVRLEFDAAESRLLLAGPGYGLAKPGYREIRHPSFAQVLDLPSGRRVADLQELDKAWPVDSGAFRLTQERVLFVESGDINGAPFKVASWDLKTGRRTDLPMPARVRAAAGLWRRRGVEVRLNTDGDRLLLTGYWNQTQPSTTYQACVQLWDLPGRRLLQEATWTGISLLRYGHDALMVASDREHVYLSVTNWQNGESRFFSQGLPNAPDTVEIYWPRGNYRWHKPKSLTCWRWADGVKVSPRNESLLFAEEDHRWALWRGPRGVLLYDSKQDQYRLMQDSAGEFTYGASSQDGRLFFLEERKWEQAKQGDQILHYRSGVWNARTGQRILSFTSPHRVWGFDSTGRWVATVDQAAWEVRIWETASGREKHRLALPSLAWNDTTIRARWRINYRDIHKHPTDVLSLDLRIHPDGDRVAILSQGVIQLWDLANQRFLGAVPKPGHFQQVFAVAQHAGAGLVASGGAEGVVLLWSRRDGRLLRTLLGHAGNIIGLAFTAGGDRLASASTDGTIRLWDREGQPVGVLQDARKGTVFTCLAAHPQRSLLAAGTTDGRVLFFDVNEQKLLATRSASTTAVRSLAFSRAGASLASGTDGGQVQLWSVPGFEQKQSMSTGSAVAGLAFTPDDTILVSAGQEIHFWECTTGRKLLTLDEVRGPIQTLALSNMGREMIVARREANGVRRLDLNALHRQLHQVGLELPGYPFGKKRGSHEQ